MRWNTQPIVVGDTIDFQLHTRRGGVTLDLSTAVIFLYLLTPTKIIRIVPVTVSDGPRGISHYQGNSEFINISGDWVRWWKIVIGGVVSWSRAIEFYVAPRPDVD